MRDAKYAFGGGAPVKKNNNEKSTMWFQSQIGSVAAAIEKNIDDAAEVLARYVVSKLSNDNDVDNIRDINNMISNMGIIKDNIELERTLLLLALAKVPNMK